MSIGAKITKGKVVQIHFTLLGSEGDVLDTSRDDNPMPYLHGFDNLLPKLEENLEGKMVGDHLNILIKPEEGYGLESEAEPQVIPRSEFPEDFELEEGMPIGIEQDDGGTETHWVIGVEDEYVIIHEDHPLAGETLTFDLDIIGIRDATEEELTHGHSQEEDCGCEDDCGCEKDCGCE
jgi:FKBP-type peptidyl-prolyl cis-trans isomerase SlyD